MQKKGLTVSEWCCIIGIVIGTASATFWGGRIVAGIDAIKETQQIEKKDNADAHTWIIGKVEAAEKQINFTETEIAELKARCERSR